MEKKRYLKVRTLSNKDEKGSVALEHILFIGAIVALSAGLFVFYGKLSNYLDSVDLGQLPLDVNTPVSSTGSDTGEAN